MIDIFILIATCIASIAATTIGYKANSITKNAAAASTHNMVSQALLDLTTGEVEEARNTIGSFRYGNDNIVSEISVLELTRSYYRLTWAIERSASTLTSIKESGWEKFAASAISDQWKWHLEEISKNLDVISLIEPLGIKDSTARNRRRIVLNKLDVSYSPISKSDIDEGYTKAILLKS